MRLEIWTVDEVYHSYDLDEWVVAFEESPIGGSALAVARREDKRVEIFPWPNIVKIAHPNAVALKELME